MKKNRKIFGQWHIHTENMQSMKRMLRMARSTLFCFFLGLMQVMAIESYSQLTRISISANNETLEDVIEKIENESEYFFLYNKDLIDVEQKVSFTAKNETIKDILDEIFRGKDIYYVIYDRQIVLSNLKTGIKPTEQQRNISGKVTDSGGEPLPGVTIVIKGTTNGTITDSEGKYSISHVPEDGTLSFSFIGLKSVEVEVEGKQQIDVTMEEETVGLDEVVAIGYGTVKKSDLTGSVGSIESDKIAATTVPDAAGAIQGRVAGVNVEANVARPGNGFDITVRGLSSITESNTPLYVIDGIPTESGLTDLNPDDIEKIDVLKDASATAIYGSRGANGVIIVTTKKGKAGKFTIQYDGNVGLRTPSHLPDMMSGDEYVQWRTDLYTNLGKSTDRSNSDFFTSSEWDIIDSGNYTDWIDLILRNGFQTSNTITISGGDDKGTFALGIGQLEEEGTVPGQDFNRYNMRLNINRKIGEKWETGGSLYFTYSLQNEGSYETLRSTFRLPGIAEPYDEDGDPQFYCFRTYSVTNPMFEYSDDGEIRENRRYRAFGNVYLQFEPITGLTLRSQLSPQVIYEREGEYYGLYCKNGGAGNQENTSASYYTSDDFGYVLDNQLNYKKDIGNHNLKFSLIQSIQYEQWEYANQEAEDLPFNCKWYNLDEVTSDNIVASETDYEQESLASFLGRIQYGYNSKYLFTLTGRYDGSSRLAENHKWAFFPSAAVAWRISEEEFMNRFKNISNLKLRVSYGVSGNDAVDIYGTQSSVSEMYYDFDGTTSTSYYKSGLSNYDLTWEKTYEINVGVDYGFFNNRINGTLDVYQRDAKDLIMERELPETSGWESIWDNVGWVRNRGLEIGLNTVNIQTRDFSWTTNIIFDTNKNKIMELYGDKEDDVGNGWFIGKPIESNYYYQFDGIWQTDEADEAAVYGQTPGQIKVKDLDNDGDIDADDKKIIGQETPKWTGSITNTFKYKNWDFSFYVYTRQGQQLYSTFKSSFMNLEGNYNNVDVDYWTEDNPSNKYFQPGNEGDYFNSWRYCDVSFVRVGNISLGYSVPKCVLERVNIDKLHLYFTVTNPFTFTSYEGFDPEWADQNTWGEATGYSTYLLGINLEF